MSDRPAKPRRRRRPPAPFLAFSSFARALSAPHYKYPSPKSQATNPKSHSPNPKSQSPNPKSQIPNPKSHSPIMPPKSRNPRPPKPESCAAASDSSSSSSDDDDDEPQEEMTMQADFGFFDPKPKDFSGVKLLMQRYLDDTVWDCSGFVDLMLEQTTVGTVVKTDGDEEGEGDDDGPYVLVSALNLKRYKGHRCIGELKKYIMDVCTEESVKKELKVLFEKQEGDVGVLVSQRFVNCPYQLVPPLYDSLFDEISWATEDEPTKELRDSFRFKFYVMVTRIYMNKGGSQRKGKSNSNEDEPIIYIKAEDEIFHELSKLSFTFRLEAEQPPPPELKSYREMGLVMIVKADKVPEFRAKLKSLVDEAQ